MGHTDVVPVNETGWSRDPFGGELITVDGTRCGAAARSTCSTSPRRWPSPSATWPTTGFRPKGDLIYFAVADEESGSAHGAQWMADHERDAICADYVLTESGGLHSGDAESPFITVNVGEKGVAWRRLRLHGTPGHGSAPFRADNALVKAAAVDPATRRLPAGAAVPRAVDASGCDTLGVDEETQRMLLDPAHDRRRARPDPAPGAAPPTSTPAPTRRSRATSIGGRFKTNVIPDAVELGGRHPHPAGRDARRRRRPTCAPRSATWPTRSRSSRS